MTAVEFFNSVANLHNLANENGLLRNPEGFLMYRKMIGHSLEYDTSIILDTSNEILDPLGRPVRRDQLDAHQRTIWSRMSQVIFDDMLERYPDPKKHIILAGEASLDPTWPLSKPGVPSIRMIHNHFIAFAKADLTAEADPNNPNLTDSGHHGLFRDNLSAVYHEFMDVLNLRLLKPVSTESSQIALTGYPDGLPCWVVQGGPDQLANPQFWHEYDLILKGFLDFYRTFFAVVSSRSARVPNEAAFPDQVENILLFDNHFHQGAKGVRDRIRQDPQFANEIRWRPAYKQILYRDDHGRLIVTISQNSVGNAITELLGIVVKRHLDEEAYNRAEPDLVAKLLKVRQKLIDFDLGEPIHTAQWPDGAYVPLAG